MTYFTEDKKSNQWAEVIIKLIEYKYGSKDESEKVADKICKIFWKEELSK